jgi:hypothetical protein
MIPRLAIGYELDHGNGDGGEQEDMNEATFMEDELQDEPNKEKYCGNRPHSRNLSNGLWNMTRLVTSAACPSGQVRFL